MDDSLHILVDHRLGDIERTLELVQNHLAVDELLEVFTTGFVHLLFQHLRLAPVIPEDYIRGLRGHHFHVVLGDDSVMHHRADPIDVARCRREHRQANEHRSHHEDPTISHAGESRWPLAAGSSQSPALSRFLLGRRRSNSLSLRGVQILTIIERELRVAAHHGITWWRRLGVLSLTIAVLSLAFVEMSRWSTASRLGNELFTVAAVIMMIYAMLTGPLATADCLSRERREGTLGLLFLTPLRGVDVVLGKISAASLDHMLGLFAMLPLLAIPFMLGGVSPAQVGFAAVGIFALLLFSLSVGAWASSLCTDSRAASGSDPKRAAGADFWAAGFHGTHQRQPLVPRR